ncbi:protein RFT1 homolog isoform X1 [Amphibalanus amphitrite]|uniref:protein RFT1 homolog isoform X1 n=1 Tax=Amphibalanus amphitrite TaxID=1232801 RepID=UPI001C90046C|nr:protein RFT1 homolog isoform X1 [Amphibalanus amphitrite]XP_043202892.1 protein RFT1 homolog isoform X1 [Amphibalanus amphitrite]XP_043202896.1 protein RFT1 homolog isoform X1 [Amphibalanus amphitrite]XP_043202897.1 protein RFT1 homolog isoform X1 [Amphibalanus amphitrite]XP_043206707.1 protein RFT1 homolog isoform X1 [Amphibalanus amphitrite]XP_043206708.1 protein RFT1 homolog isoform X1 [Amphibalanus amphitrite]XP_043206712.1 protein RFT1 homolog isoform X1 [Amphibalanus amphitrite]XP_0
MQSFSGILHLMCWASSMSVADGGRALPDDRLPPARLLRAGPVRRGGQPGQPGGPLPLSASREERLRLLLAHSGTGKAGVCRGGPGSARPAARHEPARSGCRHVRLELPPPPLLLRLYGGALLAAGPAVSLLRAQCAYVLLLAVNGVLECYTFAVMRQEQINGYNRKMVLLSVIFVISTGIFTRLFGGVGFILANCVNMLTRIYVCYRFVAGLPLEPAVSVPPLLGLRPPPAVAAALVTAGLLAAGSESWLYPSSAAAHVAVGALCGAAVVAAAVYSELRLLQAVRERVGDKLKRS